jgi:hypothetical protein
MDRKLLITYQKKESADKYGKFPMKNCKSEKANLFDITGMNRDRYGRGGRGGAMRSNEKEHVSIASRENNLFIENIYGKRR